MQPPDHPDPVTQATDSAVTVLCLDSDAEYLAQVEAAFDDHETITVRTETDPAGLHDALEGVDCVVGTTDFDGTSGASLLETVREAAPAMPVLLYTEDPLEAVADELLDAVWTDYLEREPDTTRTALLSQRVRHLVTARRLDALARRYHAALENSRQATVVLSPDGTVEFANRQIDAEFRTDRTRITGQHWSTLFTDGSAQRLRADAFPIIERGWRWTGETALSLGSGATSHRQTSLTRLEDGSTIVSFHRLASPAE